MAARLAAAEVVAARDPYGTHLFVPTRPSMRTILLLHGPGVAAGVRLREARTIDLAPTLAALLGIGVVAGAQLGARLARRLRGAVVVRLLSLPLVLVAIRLLLR